MTHPGCPTLYKPAEQHPPRLPGRRSRALVRTRWNERKCPSDETAKNQRRKCRKCRKPPILRK